MEFVISIIIPFYCTPKPLFNKCMESILAVQSNEIEIVVIDDGSPKEYYSVLNHYSTIPQVRIIHTKNAGVSAARNRGIKEAYGKWILFADSDDYMDTEALKKVLVYARTNNGDVVLFNGGHDKKGKISYNTTFLKQGINYAIDEINRIAVMESALSVGKIPKGFQQSFSLGAPYCKLLRTSFLNENGLRFDTTVKFAEDTLFSLQVYLDAKDIHFVDIFLYYYVFYSESATRRYRPGLSSDMDVFFNKIWSFICNNNLEESLERAYYTRVQFEIVRSVSLEFFHPNNDDKNLQDSFLSFIHKEPYYTAMKKNYFLSERGMKGRIKYYLILHSQKKLFSFFRTVYNLIQNLIS